MYEDDELGNHYKLKEKLSKLKGIIAKARQMFDDSDAVLQPSRSERDQISLPCEVS